MTSLHYILYTGIFAEMITGKPLFCGGNETDQLLKIIKILGSPSPVDWPSLITLPGYKKFNLDKLPKFNGKNLYSILPKLDKHGLDLLTKFLQYDPNKRISAKDAMKHIYFDDLKTQQNNIDTQMQI